MPGRQSRMTQLGLVSNQYSTRLTRQLSEKPLLMMR